MHYPLLKYNLWGRILKASSLQILLVLVLTNVSFALNSKAQEVLNQRVSLSAKNEHIEVVIRRLEKLTRVQFLFSREIIQSKRRIDYQATNEELSQVLEHILTPLNLSYEVAGQRIVIKRGLAPASQSQTNASIGETMTETARDVQLSGRVTDDKGEGLPGVNIQIKSTTRGTTTDERGNYKLTVPDANAVLVFSLVGFAPQEVSVGTKSTINITLLTDNKTLDEVVVVGYGVQRKRDVTGSVVSVNEATLKEVPAPNLINQLKGRAAGGNDSK